MDYRHLIETTTEYGIEKLKEKDQKYICGMDHVSNDEFIAGFLALVEDELHALPELMADLYLDIARDVMDRFANYVDGEIAEMQVSMIDSYDDN